jgi:hypothetical protein
MVERALLSCLQIQFGVHVSSAKPKAEAHWPAPWRREQQLQSIGLSSLLFSYFVVCNAANLVNGRCSGAIKMQFCHVKIIHKSLQTDKNTVSYPPLPRPLKSKIPVPSGKPRHPRPMRLLACSFFAGASDQSAPPLAPRSPKYAFSPNTHFFPSRSNNFEHVSTWNTRTFH